MTIKTTIFSVLFFCFTAVNAQIELVSNPGFENTITCPTAGAQWNYCAGWNNANMNTGQGVWGTPDFFHTCSTASGIAPPATFDGTCSTHTGNGMMALGVYNVPYPNFREYIATPLTCTMQPGVTYTLSFWLTNGTGIKSPWTIKNIGAYFSNGPASQSGYAVIPVIPQCEITTQVASTSWVQYTFTVIPTTAWNYLTIGSFRPDASNNPTQTYPNPGGNNSAYSIYFIDDVSVMAPAPHINGITSSAGSSPLCPGVSVTLSATSPGTYSWSTGASTPSIVVSPNTTTHYTLTSIGGAPCQANVTGTVAVNIQPVPVVSISGKTLVCRSETVVLTAGGANSYVWDTGLTQASMTVAPATTTTFIVTGTSTVTGCSASAAITLVYNNDCFVGINKQAAEKSTVRLYPNPFRHELYVDYDQVNTHENGLTLVNALGQTVYVKNETSAHEKLDLSFLPAGIYYLDLRNGQNHQIKKVIKQ